MLAARSMESSSSSVDLKSSVLSNQSVVIVPVEGFMSQGLRSNASEQQLSLDKENLETWCNWGGALQRH